MNTLPSSEMLVSVAYHSEDKKSYLEFRGQKHHVYQWRLSNPLTWISYIYKKYFKSKEWETRSVSIGNKQHTFLVHKTILKDVDFTLKAIALETFEVGFVTSEHRLKLKEVATQALETHSVALFADHLRTLATGNNDSDILELYEMFLRKFTNTPLNANITINGLLIRAMEQHPISMKQAVEKAEALINSFNPLDPLQQAKAVVFSSTIKRFKEIHSEELKDDTALFNVKVASLKNTEQFSFENGKFPAYLKEAFAPKDGYIFEATEAFFDYVRFKADVNPKDFASADFANAFLGGGGLTHGTVQEEVQMLEFDEFVMLMACFPSPVRNFSSALSTRNPNDKKAFSNRAAAGKGSPDPLKITGFSRYFHFEGYGATLFSDPVNKLEPAQTDVTLIAAAAPRINKSDRFKVEVLLDIFNTLMAEMVLQIEQAMDPNNVCFSSGKIGAGVFNNDPEAVYLLHRLAGEQLGIHLKLFDYSNNINIEYGKSWEHLRSQFLNNGTPATLEECVGMIATYLHEKNERLLKAQAEAQAAKEAAKEAEAKAAQEAKAVVI